MGEIQVIDASELDRLDKAARTVDEQRRPPERTPGVPPPADRHDAPPFANQSGFEIPEGGLVWTEDGEADGVQLTGTRPSYSGISRVLVAAAAVAAAAGSPGRGFSGERPCLIRLANYAGTNVGDFVGTGKDTFDAVKQSGGIFLVLAKAETPYVRAVRIQNRLDNKVIRTGAGATDGKPVKVLIFGAEHVLSQPSPGNVLVTRV